MCVGVYKLDNSRYEGSFRNGEFHGGTLAFPYCFDKMLIAFLSSEGRLIVEGGVYQGTWRHGKLVDGRFIFKDELQYKKIDSTTPWEYCSAKDPRWEHSAV